MVGFERAEIFPHQNSTSILSLFPAGYILTVFDKVNNSKIPIVSLLVYQNLQQNLEKFIPDPIVYFIPKLKISIAVHFWTVQFIDWINRLFDSLEIFQG